MEINHQVTSNDTNIHKHILDFYKDLLGTPGHTFAILNSNFWSDNEMILDAENANLITPFTEAEIHRAVFASEAQGAPGPDGLSFAFYQFFWDLIKTDLLLLCRQFYNE